MTYLSLHRDQIERALVQAIVAAVAEPADEPLHKQSTVKSLAAESQKHGLPNAQGRHEADNVDKGREHISDLWTYEAWLTSVELPRVLADLFKQACRKECGPNRDFEFVRTLPLDRIREMLLTGDALELISRHLAHAADKLSRQSAATGMQLANKFAATEGTFEMAFGATTTFYGGLDNLIGPPVMINGSLKLSMSQEHCASADSRISFTTSNKMTTVSFEEWEFVVCPQNEKVYQERENFRQMHPDWCRSNLPLELFEGRLAERNARLLKLGHAPIELEEL